MTDKTKKDLFDKLKSPAKPVLTEVVQRVVEPKAKKEVAEKGSLLHIEVSPSMMKKLKFRKAETDKSYKEMINEALAKYFDE